MGMTIKKDKDEMKLADYKITRLSSQRFTQQTQEQVLIDCISPLSGYSFCDSKFEIWYEKKIKN